MNNTDIEIIKQLKELPFYTDKCIKIVSNTGELIPFKLNFQQLKVHNLIEKQKKETGRVRVIILKSRKLGISTYSAARFMHLLTLNEHRRAGVITHNSDSTTALFRVYKRMYDNLPTFIQPNIKKNNAKELEFNENDSSIKVSTAGSKEVGRGDTLHYLHCSEIGFWPNAQEIAAGLMRSVADVDGTEIIIESTASTIDSLFYTMWCDAVAGENSYIPIFLPWTTDMSCRNAIPEGVTFTDSEEEYKRIYQLSYEQLYWRRLTIKQLGEKKFKNEYPISPEEAFESIETDSFIPIENVQYARKRKIENDSLPLILGVDVATSGNDKTCFVWRKGDVMVKYQLFSKLLNDQVADKLLEVILQDNPSKIFIDSTGGFGGGVAAIMRLRGYTIEEINFGSKPSNPLYSNKRAEMYANLKEWILREVSIPDDNLLEMDLLSFGSTNDINGRLLIESKENIKKRLKRSPDIADALALTFAYPVGTNIHNTVWSSIHNGAGDYDW
jgi:hypothetical protein